MNGSMSIYPPSSPRAGLVRAARNGTSTVAGHPIGPPSDGPVAIPLPPHQAMTMAAEWPLHSFVELGARRGAVRGGRLQARKVLWEWGLTHLSESVELLISELITNAIKASQSAERILPVRLSLLSDGQRVLIQVWDANPQPPVRVDANDDAESGRALLLVETLSEQWDWYVPQHMGGKVVRSLVTR